MSGRKKIKFVTPAAANLGPVQPGSVMLVFCDTCKEARPKQLVEHEYTGRSWVCLVCGDEIPLGV